MWWLVLECNRWRKLLIRGIWGLVTCHMKIQWIGEENHEPEVKFLNVGE